MLSKRKALIGYGVYTAAKPFAKRAVRRKARAITPDRKKTGIAAGVLAAAAAVGAAVGGILFWRKRRSGGAGSEGT
jgi:LPXTG-motif cell wall-anchored protein